jgi:hypothetical protein
MALLGVKEEALSFSEGFARVWSWSSVKESSVDVAISSSGRQQFWGPCVEIITKEWGRFFVFKSYRNYDIVLSLS